MNFGGETSENENVTGRDGTALNSEPFRKVASREEGEGREKTCVMIAF